LGIATKITGEDCLQGWHTNAQSQAFGLLFVTQADHLL
jgi:hypothetical protein